MTSPALSGRASLASERAERTRLPMPASRADDRRGVVGDAGELVDLVVALVDGLDAGLDELDRQRDPAVAGRVDVLDGAVAGVAVEVALAGAGELGLGIEEELRVGARPAAERGDVLAGADADGAGEGVVLLAGEAVGGARLVVGAPGDRGGAVGLVEVAGDDLARVVEDEGGAAEAVGDVDSGCGRRGSGCPCGDRRSSGRRGRARRAQGRGAAGFGENAEAVQAGEGGVEAAQEQEQQEAGEHRRGGERLVAAGDVGGGLGDALAGPEDPADELAVADLGGGGEVEGLVRELAGGVVLAADGLLARVVVDVLGAAAVFGGEGSEAAVRVELPGARVTGPSPVTRASWPAAS
jgi:hypothetical protein